MTNPTPPVPEEAELEQVVTDLVERILQRGRFNQQEIEGKLAIRDMGISYRKKRFVEEILELISDRTRPVAGEAESSFKHVQRLVKEGKISDHAASFAVAIGAQTQDSGGGRTLREDLQSLFKAHPNGSASVTYATMPGTKVVVVFHDDDAIYFFNALEAAIQAYADRRNVSLLADLAGCIGELRGLGHPAEHLERKYGLTQKEKES